MRDNKELISELRSSAFVLDGLSTVVGDNVQLDSIERDRISAALHSAGDALESQPPCGTDGAALAALAALVTRDLCESEPANPDDPDTVCVHVDYVGEVIRRHYAGTGGASRALDLLTQSALDHYTPHMVCIPAEKWAEAMALLNANKSAPATAVPDGWGIYRAYGSKGELLLVHNEQKAVATSIDENNPAYGILHAMLAAQPAAPVAQSERFRGLADRLRKANKPGRGIRPGQFLSAPQILSVPQKGDHHDGPVSTTVWLHTDECAKQDGSVCICNPESTNAAPVAPATVAVPDEVAGKETADKIRGEVVMREDCACPMCKRYNHVS